MVFHKIKEAKCGKTVTIYPQELAEAEWEQQQPYTIADLISLCESFNMPYTINDTPPSFTITPTQAWRGVRL